MTTPSSVVVRSGYIDQAVLSADIELLQRALVGTDGFPSAQVTQAGASNSSFADSGNLNVQTSTTGINPGATAADNVLANFTLAASVFDKAGRIAQFTASGSFGATGNNKTIKIIANPASAVVGSTVGGGGTTIATTGVVATNGGGWSIQASLIKTGALGSNTQLAVHSQAQVGAAVSALQAPSTTAFTESSPLLIAVTGNAATATTDIALFFFETTFMN